MLLFSPTENLENFQNFSFGALRIYIFWTGSVLQLLSDLPVIALSSLFTITGTDHGFITRYSSNNNAYWQRDHNYRYDGVAYNGTSS